MKTNEESFEALFSAAVRTSGRHRQPRPGRPARGRGRRPGGLHRLQPAALGQRTVTRPPGCTAQPPTRRSTAFAAGAAASAASSRRRPKKASRTMDPQHVLEVSEDRRLVRQALARLSPKPATVLVLEGQRSQLRRSGAIARSRYRTDRNIAKTRGSRAAQGGHPWHIYLKERFAASLTTRTP